MSLALERWGLDDLLFPKIANHQARRVRAPMTSRRRPLRDDTVVTSHGRPGSDFRTFLLIFINIFKRYLFLGAIFLLSLPPHGQWHKQQNTITTPPNKHTSNITSPSSSLPPHQRQSRVPRSKKKIYSATSYLKQWCPNKHYSISSFTRFFQFDAILNSDDIFSLVLVSFRVRTTIFSYRINKGKNGLK